METIKIGAFVVENTKAGTLVVPETLEAGAFVLVKCLEVGLPLAA